MNTWTTNITNGQFEAFSLEFILGAIFSPLAWILGVPASDIMLVGQLLGEKTVLNEFYSYVSLTEMKEGGFSAAKDPLYSPPICFVDLQIFQASEYK